MQDYLGVAGGAKLVTAIAQLMTERLVVIEFPVECQPEVTAGIGHRLTTARQINDSQPSVSEDGRSAPVYMLPVGPTVSLAVDHPLDHVLRHRLTG